MTKVTNTIILTRGLMNRSKDQSLADEEIVKVTVADVEVYQLNLLRTTSAYIKILEEAMMPTASFPVSSPKAQA